MDNATLDELLSVSLDLTMLWRVRCEDPPEADGAGLRLPIVWALARHVQATATSIATLATNGRAPEAMAMVRVAFECAVEAAWVAGAPEGEPAWTRERLRQQHAFAATLSKWKLFPLSEEERTSMRSGVQVPEHLANVAPAPHFEVICNSFGEDGNGLYATYRMLSQYAHPSATIVSRHLRGTPAGKSLRLGDRDTDPRSPVWLTCACMLWSFSAMEQLRRNDELRADLSRAGEYLGAAASLGLPDPSGPPRRQPAVEAPGGT